MVEVSDEEQSWIARSRNGDQQAFEALVLRYQKMIFALAYRMTGSLAFHGALTLLSNDDLDRLNRMADMFRPLYDKKLSPLQAERDYRVTVNSFLADGGDNLPILREGRNRTEGVPILEALVGYFGRHTAVSPGVERRVRRTSSH